MHADDIRFLFDYSYAATARVLAAASRLTTEEFAAPAPIRGSASVRDLLLHTLEYERRWREGLRSNQDDDALALDPAASPDAATLALAWRADEALMRAWLETLDDAALNAPAANGNLLWRCLAHVVNHGTQHRTEAAMLLTHLNQSPGELDLIYHPHGWRDAA